MKPQKSENIIILEAHCQKCDYDTIRCAVLLCV